MEKLSSAHIKKLKALAQQREAILRIGKQGLSPEFLKALEEDLVRHELVKVKFAEGKEKKKELAPVLAEKSSSHLVTLIGNVAVLYRPNPDPEKRSIHL